MTILIFILVLSLLVIVHELGHFFMARRTGVKVEEFGFGYPPRLKKLFTWRGTEFSLNAIPFGGFVRLEGEEFNPQTTSQKKQTRLQAFYNKSILARIAVIAAGPLANILYAVVAFSIVFGVIGVPRFLNGRPRVDKVAPNSPVEQIGLSAQSEIIGFRLFDDLILTDTVEEVVEFVQLNQGQEVTIIFTGPCEGLVCPDDQFEKFIYLRTEAETPVGEGSMGVVFADFYLETNNWYLQLINGIWYGVQEALALGILIITAVFDLFHQLLIVGKVSMEIAGPVGIVHQASQSSILSKGWAPLVEFSGILSINLGIMNLLPIPALDGGRILLILLEKVVGKRRIQNIEGYVHNIGFLFLISLIILVSLRDIIKIFQT